MIDCHNDKLNCDLFNVLFKMYVVALFLVLIGQVFGFHNVPMSSEAVSAIASTIKDIKNFITAYFFFPEPVIEETKSYWTVLKEYTGFEEQPIPEKSLTEPIIICNGFVVLAFLFVPCFYILAIKKYFSTKTIKPEFVPFMDNEDADEVEEEESEYQRSVRVNDCACPHCSHKTFVDERGDL